MNQRFFRLFSIGLVLFSLTFFPAVEGRTEVDVEEGIQEIYLIKEVIETTSDYTSVEMIQGPILAAPRRSITEGADTPGLDYWYVDLDNHISKQGYDTSKVVVEVEALVLQGDHSAVYEVRKGSIGYTKLELYVYDRSVGDYTLIGGFRDESPGDPPSLHEIDLTPLYDQPTALADVGKAFRDVDKDVFAFYYQWYLSPIGPSGESFHWGGYTNHPLMGEYDSVDEAVIRAQMAVAKYSGIDCLIADYPYRDEPQRPAWDHILDVAEEIGMKISHYGLRSEHLEEAAPYFSRDSFLRDDGRPVFFHYTPSAANSSVWLDYRRRVEESLGPVLMIGNTIDDEYLGAFDGFHIYVYITGYPEDDGLKFYRQMAETVDLGPRGMDIDEAIERVRQGENVGIDIKPFFVTVVPGYDDTVVRSPGLQRDREDGALYRRLWDTANSLDAEAVLITSWNEWHEGTEIEPSFEYGFQYVNLTRQMVGEFKGAPVPVPEVSYTAEVTSLVQRPDLKGSGVISLSAMGAPAVYVNVSVRGEGLTHIDLEGNFYTYLTDRDDDGLTVTIPSVSTLDELELVLLFEANRLMPTLNVRIVAYDPMGGLHELYSRELQPTMQNTLTASTSQATITLGDEITLSGALDPELEGIPVKITYTAPDGAETTHDAYTGHDGGYRDSYTPETAGSWSAQAVFEGGGGYNAASSPIVAFTVSKIPTSLTLHLSEEEINRGEELKVSGTIDPPVSGAEVSLVYTSPDAETTEQMAESHDGSYQDVFKTSDPGRWIVTASYEGDTHHQGSESDEEHFTVKQGIPGFPLNAIILGMLIALLTLSRRNR